MRIIAVVVTHNRCELLRRCVEHLQRQTRRLEDILVVNNGSTDRTVEVVEDLGVSCITQDNVGSAGGWCRGIQHAQASGFDAVWLMDDDGYPDLESLRHLEAAMVPGVACASSLVVREDDPTRFVFPFPRLNAHDLPVMFRLNRKIARVGDLERVARDGLYPFAHFFNGALIDLGAARAVGNVDPRFFLFGDEVDYHFRLRSAGRVLSVLAARHYHPDVTRRPLTDAKLYYFVKNTFILNQRYFDHPEVRHLLTVLVAIARTGARNGWRDGLACFAGKKREVLQRAIARGWRGELGRDFTG